MTFGFENCYVVQFTIDQHNNLVPLRNTDFESKIRHVHKVRNHYVVIRNFNKYFKIRASEYSSVKELKQSATSDE